MKDLFLTPNWPAPPSIRAYTTLRMGLGVSKPPYQQFNLAEHVADSPEDVKKNRELLKQSLSLPAEPIWINQIHSNIVIEATPQNQYKDADATFTRLPNQVCAILTADCLPIFLCDQDGTRIAAIHAGWRGIAHGIIENTIEVLDVNPDKLLAWFGPAISQQHYEVGDEMRDIFLQHDKDSVNAFTLSPQKRWLANLYQLARLRLNKCGISRIYGGEHCTYTDSERFFSYRRDGAATGRMASVLWINQLL